MKKSYTIIKVLLVILFNMFFLIIIRFIPMSESADIELLASVLSTVAPNAAYLQQVDIAKSIIQTSDSENLQHAVNELGVFSEPITLTSRQAAKEALSATKSSR